MNNFLFDLDGTLIDSIPSIIESFQQALMAVYNKREENGEVFKKSIGLPLNQSFLAYPLEDRERLSNEYIKANNKLQKDGVPFFEGVKEALISLKKADKKICIVSSKRREAVMHWVNTMQVSHLFDFVVGREDTQNNKPHPEPILFCLNKMGFNKEDSIYIGDSIHDVKSAKSANVKCAVVEWTRMDKTQLKELNPDIWLFSPNDLLSL